MVEVQRFEVVGAGDIASVLGVLGDRLGLEVETDDDCERVWLDTADGVIAASGARLEHRALVDGGAALVLVRDGRVAARVEPVTREVPTTARGSSLPERTVELVGDRALQATAPVRSRVVVLHRTDADDKTVVRLVVDRSTTAHGGDLPILLEVVPLRGYDGAAKELVTDLAGPIALVATSADTATRLHVGGTGRPHLARSMSAAEGWRSVLRSLTGVMTERFGGVLTGEDPEDLHTFRVAVRRIRTVLRDGQDVLASDECHRFRHEFQWLGDVTTPARDADVHVLDHPMFVDLLPEARRADLAPLLELLVEERSHAHALMVRELRSMRRAEFGTAWAAWLDDDTRWGRDLAERADEPVVPVAAAAVRDAHRRLVKDGRAVKKSSPAVVLHDLRKDAKRLRYLLECFAPVLDADAVDVVTGPLRRLQDLLGAFQDSEVQAQALHDLLAARDDAGSALSLATGSVVEHLGHRSRAARKEFAKAFEKFDDRSVRRAIDSIDRRSKGRKR